MSNIIKFPAHRVRLSPRQEWNIIKNIWNTNTDEIVDQVVKDSMEQVKKLNAQRTDKLFS